VRDNCGECEGSSEKEFDRGVALIEEALHEGAKDRRAGLLALVDAYSEYAFSYNRQRPISEADQSLWKRRLAEVYEELLRDEPRNVSLLRDYASLIATEHKEKALEIYENVLEIQPDNSEAAFAIASLHFGSGQKQTAVAEFARALRLPSTKPDTIQNWVEQFIRDLKHVKVVENALYIEQIKTATSEALEAKAAAGNADAAFLAAILHAEWDQPETAGKDFARAVHMPSAGSDQILGREEDLVQLLMPRAGRITRENAEIIEQVKRAAAEALEAQPTKKDAHPMFSAASLRLELGQTEVAVKDFLRAVRLPSASEYMVEGYSKDFIQHLKANEIESAKYIEQVRTAAAESLETLALPNNNALLYAAVFRLELGQTKTAIEEFKRAAHLYSGLPGSAEAAFRAANIETKAEDANAAFSAAFLYLYLGQTLAAVEQFIRAGQMPSARPERVLEYQSIFISVLGGNKTPENEHYIDQIQHAVGGSTKKK
jgi:tetratricopeptide (TPR) repeat protein